MLGLCTCYSAGVILSTPVIPFTAGLNLEPVWEPGWWPLTLPPLPDFGSVFASHFVPIILPSCFYSLFRCLYFSALFLFWSRYLSLFP